MNERTLANTTRRLLITLGKVLPFLICLVVAISYAECLFSLLVGDFLLYDGTTIPNTPISFYIAKNFFEYDFLMLAILLIISVAIEACKWNLWAIVFLAIHLCEKSYIDFELDVCVICCISSINMILAMFFVTKGCVTLKKCKC